MLSVDFVYSKLILLLRLLVTIVAKGTSILLIVSNDRVVGQTSWSFSLIFFGLTAFGLAP